MAKVTITFEDDEYEGDVIVAVDGVFEPPLPDDAGAYTPAQKEAVSHLAVLAKGAIPGTLFAE